MFRRAAGALWAVFLAGVLVSVSLSAAFDPDHFVLPSNLSADTARVLAHAAAPGHAQDPAAVERENAELRRLLREQQARWDAAQLQKRRGVGGADDGADDDGDEDGDDDDDVAQREQALPPPPGADPRTDYINCSANVLQYASHSGWGNQLGALSWAVLVAGILRRNVLAPPMLSHKEIAVGSCPHARSPNWVRRKAFMSYRRHHARSYINLAELLDTDRISDRTGVRIYDWWDWHHKCRPQVAELWKVDHHCSTRAKWEPPPDTVFRSNGTAQGTDRGIKHLEWVVEDWNTALGPYRIAELRKRPERLLSFGSMFSVSLYSLRFKELKEGAVDSALVYRREFWGPACKLAEGIRPYLAVHLRGGDGPFRRRISREVQGYIKAVHAELTGNSTRVAGALARYSDAQQCGGCPAAEPGRAVRVLAVTDMDPALFNAAARDHMGPASPGAEWARAHSFRWQVATTIAPRLAEAHAEAGGLLGETFGVAATGWRAAVAQLLVDIMLASMGDFGFVGHPGSTMSHHIARLSELEPSQFCASVTIDPVGFKKRLGCPSCGASTLDYNTSSAAAGQPRLGRRKLKRPRPRRQR